jgi:hypothetical protein
VIVSTVHGMCSPVKGGGTSPAARTHTRTHIYCFFVTALLAYVEGGEGKEHTCDYFRKNPVQ